MKKSVTLSTMTALLLAGSLSMLQAEPGNFGVNGPNAWNQPLEKRVKHTDQFGDTYYTTQIENPKQCVRNEVKHASKHFKKAPKEVMEGLNATLAALQDLQKNDTKGAEAKLKTATQLFDTALKADPSLKLVPIDNEIVVYEFEGTANDIKADITLARNWLKNYRTQAARDILMPLKDEIDITTHFLPMDLYPKATKDALKLLQEGKKDAAVRALMLGVSTIVAEQVVVPIPLLTAQDLVASAAKIAKENPKAAYQHLKLAKAELHKALLLGYTDTHAKDYETIYEEMTHIQKEINAKHATGSLFKKLGNDIAALVEKHRHEQHELKDNSSAWKDTAKAHAAAAKEEDSDKLRFEREMELDAF
ncbi:YfdX family protein [Hydrogenimonas sp. SS33]|uniref:YfdX family protein n=1 Tax=Hydrogenimonas leucolamina TaxID=2954236 RepID=UPI00336BEF1F